VVQRSGAPGYESWRSFAKASATAQTSEQLWRPYSFIIARMSNKDSENTRCTDRSPRVPICRACPSSSTTPESPDPALSRIETVTFSVSQSLRNDSSTSRTRPRCGQEVYLPSAVTSPTPDCNSICYIYSTRPLLKTYSHQPEPNPINTLYSDKSWRATSMAFRAKRSTGS
jgi:hypothetical protein